MNPDGGRITAGKKVEITAVHGDLNQQVIQITVDRLCLVLHRHVEKTTRSRDWIAPAGVLLSIILTFASTTFRDNILKAAVWSALFLLLGIAALVWLVVTLSRLVKAESVDDLVNRIKSTERP
jgi:hypothetical protein